MADGVCVPPRFKKNKSINLCGATFTRQNLILAADDPADKTWLSCHYWLNIREDPVWGGGGSIPEQ